MGNVRASNSLWNNTFLILLFIGLITSLGFSMVYTIITPYAVEIGATLSIAGMVAGLFSIAALILRPISGLMSDRYNKKKVFASTKLLIAIASIGYALSPNISVLMIFRIFHGAAFAVSGTACISLISEYVPKKRLAEGLGFFGVSQVISRVIGPTLGVKISEIYSYNVLFIIIAFLNIIAFLVLLKLPYNYKSIALNKTMDKKISIDSLIAKKVLIYAIVGGVFSLGNGVISSFLLLLGDKRAISGISIYFAVNAIALSLLRAFLGRQADKKSITLIVNISLFCSAISMIFLGFAHSLTFIIIAAIFKATGIAGGQVSLQAECIRRVDERRSGVAASTYYIGADIGNGVGPIIGGAISSAYNYKIMYLAIVALIGITSLIFNIYQIKQRA